MAEDYDKDDLARRVADALDRHFGGNKRAAYVAAKVSPQTFERALGGETIRRDTRLSIEAMLATIPTAEPSYVSAPDDGQGEGDVSNADLMAAIRAMRRDIEELKRGR